MIVSSGIMGDGDQIPPISSKLGEVRRNDMDMSRKINSNAGKGVRYKPSSDSQEFGEANRVSAGAGISPQARIPTQAHGSTQVSGAQPSTDMSGSKPTVAAPGISRDVGPKGSVYGKGTRVTQLPAGDAPRRAIKGNVRR